MNISPILHLASSLEGGTKVNASNQMGLAMIKGLALSQEESMKNTCRMTIRFSLEGER
jgi:hypothetical protein